MILESLQFKMRASYHEPLIWNRKSRQANSKYAALKGSTCSRPYKSRSTLPSFTLVKRTFGQTENTVVAFEYHWVFIEPSHYPFLSERRQMPKAPSISKHLKKYSNLRRPWTTVVPQSKAERTLLNLVLPCPNHASSHCSASFPP